MYSVWEEQLKVQLTFYHQLAFLDLIFFLLEYLCPMEANTYNIEFTRFKLRDLDTQTVLLEVSKPEDDAGEEASADSSRYVRYLFPPDFLHLRNVGAT